MIWYHYVLLILAGIAAGFVNMLAGNGSLITLPALIFIGLPANVAYACLAETVVLALEGRYETFTVGRNIESEKVKEIYRLGLKHGMRLATISGVNGPYNDEDLRRVRELALERRTGAAAG